MCRLKALLPAKTSEIVDFGIAVSRLSLSHIQLLRDHLIGLFHDEFIAGRGVFAEQFPEGIVGFYQGVDFDFQERAACAGRALSGLAPWRSFRPAL